MYQNRHESDNVNIFLVAINAEIKFRRYFKMIENHPPPTPLPDDVITLMHRVIELVQLLYWTPVSQGYTKGTHKRAGRPTQTWMSSGEEGGVSGEVSGTSVEESGKYVLQTSANVRISSKWLPDADAETRRAYGTALMGIQGTPSLRFIFVICEC